MALGGEERSSFRARDAGTRTAGAEARARELLELTGLAGSRAAIRAQLSWHATASGALLVRWPSIRTSCSWTSPFGALDAQTKVLMQNELDRMCASSGRT